MLRAKKTIEVHFSLARIEIARGHWQFALAKYSVLAVLIIDCLYAQARRTSLDSEFFELVRARKILANIRVIGKSSWLKNGVTTAARLSIHLVTAIGDVALSQHLCQLFRNPAFSSQSLRSKPLEGDQ